MLFFQLFYFIWIFLFFTFICDIFYSIVPFNKFSILLNLMLFNYQFFNNNLRMYGKFMSYRSYIRKAISQVFFRYIYETGRYV